MGIIITCCGAANNQDSPYVKPLLEENSTPTATISTKQNSPYPQTRGFYEDLSDFSLEDECLFPRCFSSAIKRTPGRPSTPRNETGESSHEDSLGTSSGNNFYTPRSVTPVTCQIMDTSDPPSESRVETCPSNEILGILTESMSSVVASSGVGSLKEDSGFDSRRDVQFPNFSSTGTRKDSSGREESALVSREGGSLKVEGVELFWPSGALDDPETITLALEDPCKHYRLIFQRGLENDLSFGANVINLQPNGLKFNKSLTLKITLDKSKGPYNEWLVLHGKQATDGNIFWETITDQSRFDLVNGVVTTEINGFSIIAVLLRSIWVQLREIVTRLNIMSFKYTLSVLYRSNLENYPFEEVGLALMSQDVYQERYYREHDECVLEKLKRDGFEELGSNVREETNYIYNGERLVVSIRLGEDYKLANNQRGSIEMTVDSSVWWSTGKSVTFPLQSSCTKAKILCGKVKIEGQYGHTREDDFCQLDLSCYLRRLLGVGELAFNLRPVHERLELPAETWSQAVSRWQREDKQLETLLQRWKEQERDETRPALLKRSLEGLRPEEYRINERGQMHITHLRELATSILCLNHEDRDMMKYLENEIRNLCRSILRDCCIEIANSKEDMKWASSIENHTNILVTKGIVSNEVSQQYKAMFSSAENVVKDIFLRLVPHLVQAVKDIFRDESIPLSQSGMRGLDEETVTRIASAIQNAAKDKKILSLFTQVSNILEKLCHENNNNPSQSTDEKIQEWGRSVMVITMLDSLEDIFETAGSDPRRLRERLRVASLYLKDIMLDPKAYEGIFLRDFHNLSLSLLKFSKFDPSQLVRFELIDPNDSSNTQSNDLLKYQMFLSRGMRFSQLFWINKESEGDLKLEAVAHVHIDGHHRKIGAFESTITIPQACSEVIDKLPNASLPVALKRNYDFWGKIRVTLYSTQKENVRKALEYLERELGEEVVDLKKEKIAESHLKFRSFAKAGTVVKLRLIHEWGSETIGLESDDFLALADSRAGGACMPDSETAAEANQMTVLPAVGDSRADTSNGSNFFMDLSHSEVIQRHQKEQRGKTEIHYHQVFMKGHVCVAGKDTSLNMQMPAAAESQRRLKAGSSTALQRSITGATADEQEDGAHAGW